MTARSISLFLTAALTFLGCTRVIEQPPIPAPDPASVKTFTATPTQVEAGQKVTLSWEVEHATLVSLSELSTGPVTIDGAAATGSVEVTVMADSVFTLTARGEGGSDSKLVAVAVTTKDPRVFLAAVPPTLNAGQSATLVWSVPGATSPALADQNGTAIPLGPSPGESGSVTVTPSKTTTYTLTADGRSAQAKVEVLPVIFSVKVEEGAAIPGGPLTIAWKTGAGEKLTLTRTGVAAPLVVETDLAKVADSKFVDTAPALLPPNGLLTYQVVLEGSGRTLTQTLTANVGVNPVVTFTVPQTATQGGNFAVSWQTTGSDSVQITMGGVLIYQAPTLAAAANGSLVLATPAAKTNVVLTATNVRGGRTVVTREVEPIGMATLVAFTADKTGITNGGEGVLLSWEVTNARNLKIAVPGGYTAVQRTGSAAETGTFTVYPNVASTQFVLTADNGIGSIVTAMVTVTVANPATFTVSASSVPRGALIQVTGHNVPGGSMNVTGLPTIEKNAAGTTFVDIRTTGTDILYSGPDSTAKVVTLPAPFSTTLFGVPVVASKLSISINGWFVFSETAQSGADNPSPTNPPLPSAALAPLAIAPYWEDLYQITANPLCQILYQVDTVGQEQRLIVQWNEVEHDEFTGSKLTFQAQVFSSGKIVFAYLTMQGLTGLDEPSVGVVNADESDAVAINLRPAEGDRWSFFADTTLPAQVQVTNSPLSGLVEIPPTGLIQVTNATTVLPANQFGISEVNFNPAAGKAEWVELTNYTATAINLAGWTVDFGTGGTHVIAGTLMLPASGRLLLGQTADAAEASAGGPTVDYVYAPTLAMPDASGSVSLGFGGGAYSSISWAAAGTPGVSLQADRPRADLLYAAGFTELSCGSTTAYGSSGQLGTPRAANKACFPWTTTPGTGTFQSILATGTPVGTMVATGTLNSSDTVAVALDFTAAGGRAVSIAGQLIGNATNKLYVMSDGFLSLLPASSSLTNPTIPATTSPNAVAAIFWDDLSANTTASGVYWQQFDPDTVPASGDEYTLISYENWRRYNSTATNLSSLNFQVKLHEGTGDIEYLFGTMTATTVGNADGSSATTWLESVDGKAALKINVNSATAPGIQSNTAFKFVYTP